MDTETEAKNSQTRRMTAKNLAIPGLECRAIFTMTHYSSEPGV